MTSSPTNEGSQFVAMGTSTLSMFPFEMSEVCHGKAGGNTPGLSPKNRV